MKHNPLIPVLRKELQGMHRVSRFLKHRIKTTKDESERAALQKHRDKVFLPAISAGQLALALLSGQTRYQPEPNCSFRARNDKAYIDNVKRLMVMYGYRTEHHRPFDGPRIMVLPSESYTVTWIYVNTPGVIVRNLVAVEKLGAPGPRVLYVANVNSGRLNISPVFYYFNTAINECTRYFDNHGNREWVKLDDLRPGDKIRYYESDYVILHEPGEDDYHSKNLAILNPYHQKSLEMRRLHPAPFVDLRGIHGN